MARYAWFLALLLAGCASLNGDRSEAEPGRAGFTRKQVTSKRPPIHLIARDRTVCSVSEDRYRTTSVGDSVWCFWKRAPTVVAGRDGKWVGRWKRPGRSWP